MVVEILFFIPTKFHLKYYSEYSSKQYLKTL